MDNKKIGVLCVLTASFIWAIEVILVKFAYRTGGALDTLMIRNLIIAFIAIIYLTIINRTFSLSNLKISRTEFYHILLISVVLTIADGFFYFGLGKVSAVNGVLVSHMQPIFIVLFGYFLLREKLTKFDYVGILVMLFSALLVTTKTFDNLLALKFGSSGDFLILTAACIWGLCAVLTKKYLSKISAAHIVFYRFITAFVLLFIYIFSTSQLATPNNYQLILGVVVGIGIILYYEGFQRIKAAQVSALELASPFFAAILGFLILRETVTIFQIIGILLMFLGVYFLAKRED